MKKVFTLVAMFALALGTVASVGCGGDTKKTTTSTTQSGGGATVK